MEVGEHEEDTHTWLWEIFHFGKHSGYREIKKKKTYTYMCVGYLFQHYIVLKNGK